MIQKICDVCRNTEITGRLPYIASIEMSKLEGWEYVFGKKYTFEICSDCFERIMREAKQDNK